MKKWWLLVLIIVLFSSFVVYSQTKPSGNPPAPFWSPRPITAQGYINVICSGGDSYYQEWCAWLAQHPEDVPVSYYSGSTPSGTTPTPTTCLSLGGTCKSGTCSNYGSCSLLRGATDCSSGYSCCSGTCTSGASTTISIKELRDTLIDSIRNYFINLNNAGLIVDELKDLIMTYFSTSGNTVDLSGTGHYSGERLIDVYNKAKGITPSQNCTTAGGTCKPNACSTYNNCNMVQATCITGYCCSGSCTSTCTPSCTGKCGGVSDGCGGTCSASCGLLGSKTNPISLSEPSAGRIYNGYVPPGSEQDAYSHGGWVTSLPHSTLWFVIDPFQVIGKPAKAIALGYKWEMKPQISCVQSKTTGEYTPEIKRPYFKNIIYDNNPYDLDKYRFLWAFVNDGDVALKWSIWATIVPYAGVDTCTSAGEKCMPTYCNLYTNCQESSNTCAESFCCVEKMKGAACVDPCISKGGKCMPNPCDAYSNCGPTPKSYITNCVSGNYCCTGTCSGGVGSLGSKTNPLKLNTPTPKYPTTRYATAASALNEGGLALAPGSKTYFVIDPLETKGISVSAFAIDVMTYNQAYTLCRGILQDKITGNFITGGDNEVCRQSVGFKEIVYDNGKPYTVEIDKTRFIYAIENPYDSTFTATITIVADIPSPTETISVSFSNPTTTGTSGQLVSFTASATSSLGHSLQYNFIWGDGTSTGFGSASTQSHTYNTTTTQTYTVTVQAKCPTDNVSGQASTQITISGSGGGGTGTLGSKTNPYKINKPTSRILNGYIPENSPDNSNGLVTIPAGSKVYFEVDPVAIKSVNAFKVGAVFYAGITVVCKFTQDKTTGSYSPEDCRNYTGVKDIVYDSPTNPISNRKFLYAIDNTLGSGPTNNAIYAEIPFIP